MIADSVEIIIVNWNSGPLLARCLDGLSDSGIHIIVADNDSTDGSDQAAERAGVTLLRNGRNLGFGAACNIAAGMATREFLLFLNPDAAIEAGTIAELVSALRRQDMRNYGIAGPALYDEAGHIQASCSTLPRLGDFIGRIFGMDRLGLAVPPLMLPKETGPVGQVMGAALLIRRDLFERLGGFDPRFFLYFEDLDLSRRAAELGFESLYLKETAAIHRGHGSSGRIKSRRLLLWLRSRRTYARIAFGSGPAFALHVLAVTIEPVMRSVHLGLSGRIGEIPGALWAHIRFALAPNARL